MTERVIDELYAYAVPIRRKLHQYPEVGFELERTTNMVAEELDKLGIAYTTEYGRCSLVAELGQGEEMIALRADMDALPTEEKTGLPYSSRIPGNMHACGHDAHTAILLSVAKYLKQREQDLNCRVRLIFQPSEECAESGAKMMMESGVMDGVSRIIGTHCENMLETGVLGICSGNYQAACIPATVRFIGKASHATIPEAGVDAVAMAVDAYVEMKSMVAREADGKRYIWSVGRFSGGQVHNVIADCCEMNISFRFYDMEFARRVEQRVREICGRIAEVYGGAVEIDWHMSTGPVHNDPEMVRQFEEDMETEGLHIQTVVSRMSSEDFGWYLTKAPGMIFLFGTRNEALGCTAPAHRCDFKIDEAGMKNAIRAFIACVEMESEARE